jgi:hypothetical protein
MKICRPRPQLVFTFDNRFSSTGCAGQQSVRYIIFRLQGSYLSATSHTGRESCRVKSLYMKRFWLRACPQPPYSFAARAAVLILGFAVGTIPASVRCNSLLTHRPPEGWWMHVAQGVPGVGGHGRLCCHAGLRPSRLNVS